LGNAITKKFGAHLLYSKSYIKTQKIIENAIYFLKKPALHVFLKNWPIYCAAGNKP
jgi:hypothetical protein